MIYDYIIIGSGAGGSAAAYQLVQSGKSVLLLEQGNVLPRDGSTLDVDKVVRKKQFIDDSPWLDRNGKMIAPQERFNLGGKTKWYGAALARFSDNEFGEDHAHQCLPWPISYAELEPFYEAAERILDVRTFPIEPDFKRIVDGLQKRDSQWRSLPLTMGLSADILNFRDEVTHFDAFASVRGLKADGEKFLDRVKADSNLTILTGKKVKHLIPDTENTYKVAGVACDDGSQYQSGIVMLAAGALHSPRLLQRYVESAELAKTLACYSQIGRNYKFHLLTAMLMMTSKPQTDVLRKTTVLLHDALPHSSVQPLGWMDGTLLAPELPSLVPTWLANMIGQRVYGFFLQTEDGSHPDNRVIAAANENELSILDYDSRRLPAALAEHRQLVSKLKLQLLSMGYLGLTKQIPLDGTAHACGTLVAGNDPKKSVVDANGKVHGLENVYVVDGSVLPRSSRVNPALTIYAWSLRVTSILTNGRRL
jgi:choline dehydrogenase-like flavoprotein